MQPANVVAESARSGRHCKLHLRVHAQTRLGQFVRVRTKDHNGVEEALPLVTSPEDHPVWRTPKPLLVPRGVTHSYSYLIVSSKGEVEATEEIGPRTVLADAPELQPVDQFGLRNDAEPSGAGAAAATGGESPAAADAPDEPGETHQPTASSENLQQLLEMSGVASEDSGLNNKLATEMENRRLILVCFHLPVVLRRNPEAQPTEPPETKWTAEWSESLIARSDVTVADFITTRWVGSVQVPDCTDQDKIDIEAVLEPMGCRPIFAPPDMIRDAYYGYCKSILWPSFHNVDILDLTHADWADADTQLHPEDSPSTRAYWAAFQDLNRLFATTICGADGISGIAQAHDVIWVHDYHLMLLPKMIRDNFEERARPTSPSHSDAGAAATGPGPAMAGEPAVQRVPVRIIFFLHIPFSTSQIYRSLQQGNKLLEGMVNADVVGFHAFDHARHFLNACKRNAGMTFQTRAGGLIGLDFHGRTVMVVIRHVSIETRVVKRRLAARSDLPDMVERLRTQHPGKRLIAGLDTCQRLSGVYLKFLGFERLLSEWPSWRGEVVLVQRCLLPKSRPEDEATTSRELRELAQRINETYESCGPVIDYQEVDGSRLDFYERAALWLSCDVLLNTPVREGLNLDCFEFVYVKHENPGVIVASEFSSSSAVLNGAIRTNPFSTESIAKSLDKALSMGDKERHNRRHRDVPYVSSRPSNLWTRQILNDMFVTDDSESTTITDMELGNSTAHSYTTGAFFSRLDPALTREAYKATSNRVFILDYGGTLRENERLTKYIKQDINPCHKGRKLPTDVHEAIRRLTADPQNVVYVISGLARNYLDETFKELPDVGLMASNGLCYTKLFDEANTDAQDPSSADKGSSIKMPKAANTRAERDWFVFDYGVDWDQIKSVALPIMRRYTARTNGSSIRERAPTVAWSYYRTDPEWGIMQARKLHAELQDALISHNVQVIHEKGELQIVPRNLHKGVAVKRVLQKQAERTGSVPDFIFVIGDDASDEKMFSSALSFAADDLAAGAAVEDQRIFNCTVGKKSSLAGHYVNDPPEVLSLLLHMTAPDP